MSDDAIIIVGAGQAGANVARSLRSQGFKGPVTLLGAEPNLPYERPVLSKAYLDPDISPEFAPILSAESWNELDVQVKLNTSVEHIDTATHRLRLADGRWLDFSKLVLATGGSPALPPISGLSQIPYHVLRTHEDAIGLRAAFETSKSIAIIGGGWIGLEIAAAAVKRDLEVHLFEATQRLAERSAPPVLSDWLLHNHRHQGVQVHLDTRIEKVFGDADKIGINFGKGNSLMVDSLIIGTGLEVNCEMAERADIACDSGILTDWTGRTSHPDIFAVGDVAQFTPPGGTIPIRLESWDNANKQASACANGILGNDPGIAPVPWFWSDQFGNNIQLLGLPQHDKTPIARIYGSNEMTWMFLAEGRLVGAVAVNRARDIGICRRLMTMERQLDSTQLGDVEVDLKSLLRVL